MNVNEEADATVFLLQNYNGNNPSNVESGDEVPIKELALMAAQTVGLPGKIRNSTIRPDETPRKALNCSALSSVGWLPKTPLEAGVASTYERLYEHQSSLRCN